MPKTQTDGPKRQIDKFRDLARQIDADEDEATFKAKLVKVAKAPHRPKRQEPQG